MSLLRLVLAVFLMCVTSYAHAANCVVVTMKDENGAVIKSDTPVVGLLVAGMQPIVNQTIPYGTIIEPGMPSQCPAELIASVKAVFDEGCVTAEARERTAKANGATLEALNERCQALYKAVQK